MRNNIGRDPLVSPVTPELKDCLVWRDDPDPLDPPVLLDHQVTPSLSLQQLSRVVRQSRVFPGLQVPWELPDLLENEEPMVREVQVEDEESPAWRALLELLEGRDYLEDRAILGTLESLDGP